MSGLGSVTLTGCRDRARAYAYSSVVIIRRRRSLPVTDSGMVKTDFSCPASSWNGTGTWPLSPMSGLSPSTCSVSWSMNVCRRSSPSEMTSRPTPSCMAIAWSTARSSISLYSAVPSWPASNCSRASFRYCGRSSDPMVSARYTCAMSGPSFAISPAQQRLERLPESIFGCVGCGHGPPAHETVRSYQHGTRR